MVNAYEKVLKEVGCKILSDRKIPLKNQIEIVFRTNRPFPRTELEKDLQSQVPLELHGTVDWETS